MNLNLETMAHLSTLYSEPHRKYHNLTHIHQCLKELSDYEKSLSKEELVAYLRSTQLAVELMIWFHDCYYDPLNNNGVNEFNSELVFRNYAAKNDKLAYDIECEVSRGILLSAKHTEDHESEFLDNSQKIFLDIDLSGLGGNQYLPNAKAIREEYKAYSDKDFLMGRISFLTKILERKRIYYTDYFYNKYEANARRFIQTELHLIETRPEFYKLA